MAAVAVRTSRATRVAAIAAVEANLGQKLTSNEISNLLGVSRSYASALIHDPTGEQDRERKKRYGGVCEKCGGPTDGSSGRAKAPKVCMGCLLAAGERPPRSVGDSRPRWDEQGCLDSIVRWVERNQRIPRAMDLLYAEPGERPCLGTIVRHCYRHIDREEWVEPTTWNPRRWLRRWTENTRNLHDVLVALCPRFPSNVVILTAQNALLRARLLEIVGIEEIVAEGGEKVGSDEFGVLWRIDTPPRREGGRPGEPYLIVEVVNSTPEPDGSFRNYYLRVPPDVESPHAAIAWTFGVEADEYELAVQT